MKNEIFTIEYKIGEPYQPYDCNNQFFLRTDISIVTVDKLFSMENKITVCVESIEDYSDPIRRDQTFGILTNYYQNEEKYQLLSCSKCIYCREGIPHSVKLHETQVKQT